jgi:hypothetical protein
MEKLRDLITRIGLEELVNCTLVKAGARNAFLIQPADYKETYSSDPFTAAKLAAIESEFPELIQSNISGETVISKKSYSESNIKNNGDMGKIIGYPCAREYNYTLSHPDDARISIQINAVLKAGYNENSIQILAFICRDERTFKNALKMAADFEKVLTSDPLLSLVVSSVTAKKNLIVSPKLLINKLISNSILSSEESDELSNYIWNLGFENIADFRYNLKNPVHRGIVIGLLTIHDNNPNEPFYPLQYRKEHKEVNKKTEAWGNELIRIFSIKVNGGSKTRKN